MKITKNSVLDIFDTLTEAEAIRDNPRVRTPNRLKVGLMLVRFGIKLLKKIV